MHICMVVFSDLRYDFRVFREATTLRDAGHQVRIVASHFTSKALEGWDGIQLSLIAINRRRSLRLSYPAFWRRAYSLMVDTAADAYHAHDLDALLPAARAARHHGVPLVYDSHEFFTEQSSLVHRPAMRMLWLFMERHFIGQAHRVLTVSGSIAASLEKRYRLSHVDLVRNLPPYRASVPSDAIRVRLGLDAQRPIVLYQGGFLTDNGLREQIEAADGFGEAAFVLLGDGPSEEALRQQVSRLGLERRVYFIPRVPFAQLHALTCSADLGLCLIKGSGKSFYHSMPNKLFEYFMAGLPVIASDFPEMRRVITEYACGQVVAPTDQPAIARAVRELLADSSRRHALGRNALRAAMQLNWEHEAPALLRIYQEL